MPSLATITINDGQATPVAHAFAPVTTDGSLAALAERTGVPVGYPKLTVSVRPPVNGNGLYRLKLDLKRPTVVTVDGVSTVDYTSQGTVEMLFSERSTEQERKDIRVLIANALANATVIQVIEKLEPLY